MTTGTTTLTTAVMDRAAPARAELLAHPFFAAFARGETPDAAMHRWIAQDIYFARAIRRSLGLLVADAPDEHAVDVLTAAYHPLNVELGLFLEEGRRYGVSGEEAPVPSTSAFVDMMMDTARRGFAVGIGSYWAAEAFYLELWAAMRDRAAGGPYGQWIANWTDEPFPTWVGQVGELVDRHGDPEAAAAAALSVFDHERAFWRYAWEG